MVRTVRQAISEVLNDPGVVNMDEILPKKYIYTKLMGWADAITRRDSDSRRVFTHRYLFSFLEDCTELIPVTNDCCEELPRDYVMKRTKNKIPNTLSTIMGSALAVYTVGIHNGLRFEEASPKRYAQIVRRSYRDPEVIYYWRSGDYLYFPEIDFDVIRIEGAFTEPFQVENGKCTLFLDTAFVCPDYLFADVKKATVQELLTKFQRGGTDQVPDMNSNIKQIPNPNAG